MRKTARVWRRRARPSGINSYLCCGDPSVRGFAGGDTGGRLLNLKMQITRPVPAADPVEHTDGRALTEGEEIAGGIFRSIVFPHLDREHIWVQSCLFAGCLFPACTLRGSHFTDVTFRNCDLSNADLTGCSFQRVEFLDCKLMGTNLSEATMQHVAFERCKAEFANFALGRLRFVAHGQGVMRGAVFDECRLEKVAFSRCDLTQGEFRGTRLRGLSFADSDIRGMRVGEVDSFELKGLKINVLQAVDLVRLLGVEVEE